MWRYGGRHLEPAAMALLCEELWCESSRRPCGPSCARWARRNGRGFRVALLRLELMHGATRMSAAPPLPACGVIVPAYCFPVSAGAESPSPGVLKRVITTSLFAPSTTGPLELSRRLWGLRLGGAARSATELTGALRVSFTIYFVEAVIMGPRMRATVGTASSSSRHAALLLYHPALWGLPCAAAPRPRVEPRPATSCTLPRS